jgi:hypothetical protein
MPGRERGVRETMCDELHEIKTKAFILSELCLGSKRDDGLSWLELRDSIDQLAFDISEAAIAIENHFDLKDKKATETPEKDTSEA